MEGGELLGEYVNKYRTNVEPRFDEIEKWVGEGCTKQEIADLLEISAWSLSDYAKKHPRLAKILDRDDKWNAEILPRLNDIKEWLAQGETVRGICKRLAISPDYWYNCIKRHEILAELVVMGRSLLCNQVEKSLLRLCTGYDYEELKTTVEETANGKKKTKIEKIKRHQPPSAAAISFYLRNRMPEEWSDKKELILDTSQNEDARKQLFMQMVNGEIIDADFKVADDEEEETLQLQDKLNKDTTEE